jgi:hypothetical protein
MRLKQLGQLFMPIIFFPAAPLFGALARANAGHQYSHYQSQRSRLPVARKKAPTKDQILSRANEAFAAQRIVQAEKDYREVLALLLTIRSQCVAWGFCTLTRGK